eukprot:3284101-Pyramimonas_sp.AAC.1
MNATGATKQQHGAQQLAIVVCISVFTCSARPPIVPSLEPAGCEWRVSDVTGQFRDKCFHPRWYLLLYTWQKKYAQE